MEINKQGNAMSPSKSIDNLSERVSKLERLLFRSLPKWVYWVWLIALAAFGLSVIAMSVGVFPHTNWNVEVVSLSIILAFVGVLATFIVVSNYSQMREVERKFEKQAEDFAKTEERINLIEQKANNTIEQVQTLIVDILIGQGSAIHETNPIMALDAYLHALFEALKWHKAQEVNLCISYIETLRYKMNIDIKDMLDMAKRDINSISPDFINYKNVFERIAELISSISMHNDYVLIKKRFEPLLT